jgi:hypothetical protein
MPSSYMRLTTYCCASSNSDSATSKAVSTKTRRYQRILVRIQGHVECKPRGLRNRQIWKSSNGDGDNDTTNPQRGKFETANYGRPDLAGLNTAGEKELEVQSMSSSSLAW